MLEDQDCRVLNAGHVVYHYVVHVDVDTFETYDHFLVLFAVIIDTGENVNGAVAYV